MFIYFFITRLSIATMNTLVGVRDKNIFLKNLILPPLKISELNYTRDKDSFLNSFNMTSL